MKTLIALMALSTLAAPALASPDAGSLVGHLAPAFSLPSDRGGRVRLSDFSRQPVILAFFPKAFTPG